jgi:hypothetical protein
MRKSIILAVVLMAALVAVPAFASVQNVKISGSIDNTWLYRDSFDFGSSLTTNAGARGDITVENVAQSVFISQATLRVDADLTDQVSTTVALINEREWDQDAGNENHTDIDLYLAYVTLREMLYSPLTVVVGRQVFSYGNSLIVDGAGTNDAAGTHSGITAVAGDLTKQKSLDAIRLIFDYNPLTLELLYAKIDEGTATTARDSLTDDIDLYGINTTYELGDEMETQVEGYVFARIDQTSNIGIVPSGTKSDTLYVPGLRASANVLDGLNVQGEVAWQRGNNVSNTITRVNNEKREAMAAQFISNYQIPADVLPGALEGYNPVLGYVYTWVTGDSNPTNRGDALQQASTNKDTAWDPFLEAQGGGTIYNTLFSLSNLHIHTVSLTANPIEDVTTKFSWSGLWLDKKIDEAAPAVTTFALNRPDAAGTFTPTVDKSRTSVGNEFDFQTTYDYTEDVQIGANLGWFVPGNLFVSGNDTMASQAIVHGNVNF